MIELLAFVERHPWGSLVVFVGLCLTLIEIARAFGRGRP